jgi:cbb3-type cytochrome oxidase subunit 3
MSLSVAIQQPFEIFILLTLVFIAMMFYIFSPDKILCDYSKAVNDGNTKKIEMYIFLYQHHCVLKENEDLCKRSKMFGKIERSKGISLILNDFHQAIHDISYIRVVMHLGFQIKYKTLGTGETFKKNLINGIRITNRDCVRDEPQNNVILGLLTKALRTHCPNEYTRN